MFAAKGEAYGKGNIGKFGEQGVIIRLNDKIERLINLSFKNSSNDLESVRDTWLDVVGYGLIGLMCHDGGLGLTAKRLWIPQPLVILSYVNNIQEKNERRLALLDELECQAEQVRYLYLNVPGTSLKEIGSIAQVPYGRVLEIIRGDPIFMETIETRRVIEIESARLVRIETQQKLDRRRGR